MDGKHEELLETAPGGLVGEHSRVDESHHLRIALAILRRTCPLEDAVILDEGIQRVDS